MRRRNVSNNKLKVFPLQNCGYLVNDAFGYLEDLIDDRLKPSDDADYSYNGKVSRTCDSIEEMICVFLKSTMKLNLFVFIQIKTIIS